MYPQIEILRHPHYYEMCDITYMSGPSENLNTSHYLIVRDKNGHEFLAKPSMGCWKEMTPLEIYNHLQTYQNERAILRTPGGAFSFHEVVDRLYTVQLMFDELVCNHIVVSSDSDLRSRAGLISEALARMYNVAAARPYNEKSPSLNPLTSREEEQK